MTYALILEILKLCGWITALVVLFVKRRGVPLNIFYLMLLSSLMMIYAGVEDLSHPPLLVHKSLVWSPANLVIVATYIVGVLRYNSDFKRMNDGINSIIKRFNGVFDKKNRDENK